MTRGDDAGNAIEYKLMEPITSCPTHYAPGKTLFGSKGENLIFPKKGDIIKYDRVTYLVEYTGINSGSDRDGKRSWSAIVGLIETEENKELERVVLNP